MARVDWAATPVGPVEGWPQSLRAAVRTVLSSRYPMLVLWGDGLTQLYNDAYSQLIGEQHPSAMGRDVRETLASSWHVLGPLIDEAVATGVASWVPALQLLLERSGYREEAYFSVSHAPVRDDDGSTVGVLTVCSEVTEQVVGERRLRLLRELAVRAGETTTVAATGDDLAAVLARHPLDVPFAAAYVREGAVLRRVALVGPVADALPAVLDVGGDPDPWGLRAAAAGRPALVTDVPARVAVPSGPWHEPVREALALPLASADRGRPVGVLVTGVSAARALDDPYRSFVELLAQQVAVAVRNARAHEEERARAEALAELDREKTAFFTGVSHEFRTPLTLMLGPLADALDAVDEPLGPAQRERVETARRNALRLRGLVDDLLTFSSIEAGRAHGRREVVDLAALTTDLASAFRAAVERAGLRLQVDCPPLPRRVALDPAAWERVVTNLLSNALKHTFVGGLAVVLRHDLDGVVLEVADTGIGIAPEEQGRLFERFHRVAGARSRSHEGSGIGLALVRELVLLQGGGVAVRSAPGEGSTFVVTLPWAALDPAGAADAPAAGAGAAPTAAPTGRAADAADAAEHWLAAPAPSTGAATPPGPGGAAARADDPLGAVRVLVVDDNADMRAYLERLLTAQGWAVEAVEDGEAALAAVRLRAPDVVLTDVMMPRVDGFELLRALRRAPGTAALPVVVLSARAGQEASVEGFELGADDYVVKPFTAGDLVARLRTTVALARLRTAHRAQLDELATTAADTAAVIASGRALEDAVLRLTRQARALLGGAAATSELVDDDGGRLSFTDPEGAAPVEPGAAAVAAEDVRGRDGRRLGGVAVRLPPGSARPPVELLRPLARMLGAVAEGRWQLERTQRVALVLQRSLLPDRLPDVPGLELAARYLPAPGQAEVGGDWYDAVDLPDGRLAVCVGDVEGHGLGAATAMGQLRAGARAHLGEGLGPADVLGRLEPLVARLGGVDGAPATATALVVRLDPSTGALEWASAGHLPPVLQDAGGARWLSGEPGAPLGTGPLAAWAPPPVHRAHLAPGGVLLLCTDGLVEDRGDQLEQGMPRLLRRLGAARGAPAPDVVDAVLAGHPGAGDAGRTGAVDLDDVAVLVVRRLPAAPLPAAAPPVAPADVLLSYPSATSAAAGARRDLRRHLAAAGVPDDVAYELLVAVSEAVNNAVEHAQDPARPEVEVHLVVAPRLVRVAVRDSGGWRERRASMDRGRGSTLMAAFADVRVAAGPTGTTVELERRL
ncbi:response regulator [Vallicoccus soli]|uniref:histidine kinase n=2 Tax=Vallicoccus soli TaxID=2339232 RepID=A0A3A3Z1S1_9ACTN|nr:response regulator [Vallicoccus soli]